MSILPALALNGQLLNGHPVLVKPSESEKNAAAQLAKVQAAMIAAPNPLESQLRISNVHKVILMRGRPEVEHARNVCVCLCARNKLRAVFSNKLRAVFKLAPSP